MSLRYEIKRRLSPRYWLDEIKWSNQRLERGWSDRDTWGGGEHILSVTSGILKSLGDEHSVIDWDQYFSANYPNNLGYKSLLEVAADIDSYLEFQTRNWTDDLGFELIHNFVPSEHGEQMVSGNTPEEQKLISKAIDNWHKEEQRRFKKASKAMKFISLNFRSLWI